VQKRIEPQESSSGTSLDSTDARNLAGGVPEIAAVRAGHGQSV
jgi:hypothetical protein